jgi:hypothetical protein
MDSFVSSMFDNFLEGGNYSGDLLYENGETFYYLDQSFSKNSEETYPSCSYVKGEPYKLTLTRALQGNKKTEEFEVVGNRYIYRDFSKNYVSYKDFDTL